MRWNLILGINASNIWNISSFVTKHNKTRPTPTLLSLVSLIAVCLIIVLFQKKFFQAPPGRIFYYWCSLLCISIYCWYTIYIFTQQIINCHSFYRRTLGILALWRSRDNAEMGEISNGWLAKPNPVAIKCFLLCLFFAL